MRRPPIGGGQSPAIQIVPSGRSLDKAVAEQMRLRLGGVGMGDEEGAGRFGNGSRDVEVALNIEGTGSSIVIFEKAQKAGVIEIVGTGRAFEHQCSPCRSCQGGLMEERGDDGFADVGEWPSAGKSKTA